MTKTIRTYDDLLTNAATPTPYPYGGRAIVDDEHEVIVLDHKIMADEYRAHTGIRSLVQVEFPSGRRRWIGAAAVAFPSPLSITYR